jgi:hypothetical protein
MKYRYEICLDENKKLNGILYHDFLEMKIFKLDKSEIYFFNPDRYKTFTWNFRKKTKSGDKVYYIKDMFIAAYKHSILVEKYFITGLNGINPYIISYDIKDKKYFYYYMVETDLLPESKEDILKNFNIKELLIPDFQNYFQDFEKYFKIYMKDEYEKDIT